MKHCIHTDLPEAFCILAAHAKLKSSEEAHAEGAHEYLVIGNQRSFCFISNNTVEQQRVSDLSTSFSVMNTGHNYFPFCLCCPN